MWLIGWLILGFLAAAAFVAALGIAIMGAVIIGFAHLASRAVRQMIDDHQARDRDE